MKSKGPRSGPATWGDLSLSWSVALCVVLVACSSEQSPPSEPGVSRAAPEEPSGSAGRSSSPSAGAPDAAATAKPAAPPGDGGGTAASGVGGFYELEGALPLPAANDACMDATTADIDGDGDVDVLLAIEFGPNHVFLNDGSARFTRLAAVESTRLDSEDVLVLDVEGDGDLDFLTVTEDSPGTNELFLREGPAASPSFVRSALPFPADGTSNGAVLFDANADGLLDVLVANAGPNFLFVNAGDGSFVDESAQRFPPNDATTQDVEVGDVDGDGDLDIVWGNEGQNELWLAEAGVFVDASDRLGRVLDETREVDLADVDGDGDLDLLAANVRLFRTYDPANRLWLNDGSGRFGPAPDGALPDEGESTFDADFVDLDGDGAVDVVTANWVGTGPGPFRILRGDGRGNFSPWPGWNHPFLEAGLDVEAADFNGDGQLDLYLCSRGGLRGAGGRRDHLLIGVPQKPAPAN